MLDRLFGSAPHCIENVSSVRRTKPVVPEVVVLRGLRQFPAQLTCDNGHRSLLEEPVLFEQFIPVALYECFGRHTTHHPRSFDNDSYVQEGGGIFAWNDDGDICKTDWLAWKRMRGARNSGL